MAAVAAADSGGTVLLLEKMAVPGGISICSGGGFRIARDATKALEYLVATNAGAINHELLQVMARGMAELHAEVAELANACGASLVTLERPGSYPFPGCDTFAFLEIDAVPGFDASIEYPKVRSLRAGINAFKVIDTNVRGRRGIEVRCATEVVRLSRDESGAVTGVEARNGRRTSRITARRGVILACGGFESSPEMQRRYWQLRPVLPSATRGNTGDGYRMAQALGAELSHMWHFHGSYGFRHTDPAYPFGIRSKKLPDWVPEGVLEASVKMSWILVDANGRRFMNEFQPYVHDTGHRWFDRYDPATMRFPAIPAFMLFDEPGRRMYAVAKSFINDPDIAPYEWSADNLREVELGILKRADSIANLAQAMKVPQEALERTLAAWNAACAGGYDEYGRPLATRTPVATPPYYFGEVWPVVSNTQGALSHDTEQRVLDTWGNPIPRLYVAGELGSVWGFLYLSGGNLSECLISGRIAGRAAIREGAAAFNRQKSLEEET